MGVISSSLTSKVRSLSIPLSVKLNTSTTALQQNPFQGGLQCSVKARWHTQRAFSTSASALANKRSGCSSNDTVYNNTICKQAFDITLPPFYDPSTPHESYSFDNEMRTTVDLDLRLPNSISSPSLSTRLLSISYRLELSMEFKLAMTGSGKKTYTVAYSLPLSLSMTQPDVVHSVLELESLEALLEQGLVDAPPPYVC
jgi:hypothetical protein